VRDGALDKEAQTYLNRLSDFLLTVSRIAAKCDQRTENIYIPRAEVTEEKWRTDLETFVYVEYWSLHLHKYYKYSMLCTQI